MINNNKIKAVLFDMDGVLINSMLNHSDAWYATITDLGLECDPIEFYIYEGCVAADMINIIFERALGRKATPKEVDDIYQTKCKKFKQLPQVQPIEGIHTVLERVKVNGLVPLVVTGSGQETLFEVLNRFFPNTFTRNKMVTAFDVKHGKPHPEPYLQGLAKAGIAAHEAIVVENAPMGVKAGRAAGIYTIAVNTGPVPKEELSKAGANKVYDSMTQFAEDFDNLIAHLNA